MYKKAIPTHGSLYCVPAMAYTLPHVSVVIMFTGEIVLYNILIPVVLI